MLGSAVMVSSSQIKKKPATNGVRLYEKEVIAFTFKDKEV